MVATQAEIVAALGMILDKDEYVQRIKDYNAAVTAAQAASAQALKDKASADGVMKAIESKRVETEAQAAALTARAADLDQRAYPQGTAPSGSRQEEIANHNARRSSREPGRALRRDLSGHRTGAQGDQGPWQMKSVKRMSRSASWP